MNLMLTGHLPDRPTVFKRLQGNRTLEGRRVAPPLLDR